MQPVPAEKVDEYDQVELVHVVESVSPPAFTDIVKVKLLQKYIDDGGMVDYVYSPDDIRLPSPVLRYAFGCFLVVAGLATALGVGGNALADDSQGVPSGTNGGGPALAGFFVLAAALTLTGILIVISAESLRRHRAEMFELGHNWTLVIACCFWGNKGVDSLRLLIEKGANLSKETSRGKTAYDLAKRHRVSLLTQFSRDFL